MKRIFSFLCLLAVAAASAEPAPVRLVVTADRVNLRAAPLGESEVVTQVSYGDELVLHGSPSDPWVAVAVPERCDVWIFSDLLQDDAVSVKKAHLRAGAGLNYTVVGDLERGAKVKVRGRNGDWTKIAPPQIPAVSVYITNAYVKVAAIPAPAPKPAPKPPAPPPEAPAAAVAPLVVPAAPAPTAAPAAPAAPLQDEIATKAPDRPIAAPAPAAAPTVDSDKGRRTLFPTAAAKGATVGPAAIPASRLRDGIGQASSGAFAGTLARSPTFGSHPTKFRLVRFGANNDPETVCYVYGNSRQLDGMKGDALTITGAVYWFKGTSLPTIYAQEILRSSR